MYKYSVRWLKLSTGYWLLVLDVLTMALLVKTNSNTSTCTTTSNKVLIYLIFKLIKLIIFHNFLIIIIVSAKRNRCKEVKTPSGDTEAQTNWQKVAAHRQRVFFFFFFHQIHVFTTCHHILPRTKASSLPLAYTQTQSSLESKVWASRQIEKENKIEVELQENMGKQAGMHTNNCKRTIHAPTQYPDALKQRHKNTQESSENTHFGHQIICAKI